MKGKFVTYYRVSRVSQGIHGLGMDAQREAVAKYLNGGTWEVVGEFEEVESGKRADRPELDKAIALAKASKAKLLIAKMDRLARDLHFLTGLEKQGIEFVAADMPDANRFTLHILMAVAQQEREAIASRTVNALKAIRDKIDRDGQHVSKAGNVITKLGQHKDGTLRGFTPQMREASLRSRLVRADDRAARVLPTISAMRKDGATLKAVADHLNQMGVTTSRGCSWTATAVQRAEKRLSDASGSLSGPSASHGTGNP